MKHLKISKDLRNKSGAKQINTITDTKRLRECRERVVRRRNVDDEVKKRKKVQESFKKIITLMISVANSAPLEFCYMSVIRLNPSLSCQCSSRGPGSIGADYHRRRLQPTGRAGGRLR